MLKVNNLSCGYGNRTVLEKINMKVEKGEIVCVLGPNGTGKTTYFKTLLGFLKMHHGEVYLGDMCMCDCKRKQIAQKIGYVPQAHNTPFAFSVLDVVVMGRNSHLGFFSSPSAKDYKIAENSLEMMGIAHLKDRNYNQISGGERQMALIARVLTQQTDILVLDEPTSNLDFGNQIKILNKIKELSKQGRTIIMTSHFPNHAFLCPSKVAIMFEGSLICYDKASLVITEENMEKIYGITVKIMDFELEGKVYRSCMPIM